MRRYEVMCIITDTIEEEAAQAVLARVTEIADGQGANLLDQAWWGKRELAYEIHKRTHAWYAVLDLESTDEALRELERQMKLNDDIVRFKTVRPHVRVRQFA